MSEPWYVGRPRLPLTRRLSAPRAVRAEIETLLRDGVVVLKRSLPPELCDGMRAAFHQIAREQSEIFEPHRDAQGHYPRIVNIHAVFPQFIDAFTRNMKAQLVCDFLFGQETVVYTSLYYESGSQQDLHRDTPYFWTEPGWRYFGVWTAFEDTDATNGALMVVRGGHLLPEPDRRSIRERFFPAGVAFDPLSMHTWEAYQTEVQRACAAAGLKTELVPVEKGDTIIWHPSLPHGGSPITDPGRTRHSMVMHVVPVGTPVRGQEVFFDPGARLGPARWSYAERNKRRYIEFDSVSFAHRDEFRRQDLRPSDRLAAAES
jgi:ectoine hydroxylase-related dioxygenase (phytanoyl-CoA dioxygenase family)